MFKIGDFSKLTHVSIRMLRYYDEIGIFKPVSVDDFTSYRYYSASQIPTLNKIVSLKSLGFNLSEVKEIIEVTDSKKHIEILKQKKQELSKKIVDDKARLNSLENYIENYNKESIYMKYDVVIKAVPSIKVVTLRKNIPNYESEGMLWGEFMEKVNKHNVKLSSGCYAKFYEDGYTENNVDVEIGNQVLELQDDVDGLVFKETEEIKLAATLLVSGDYVPNIKNGFNYMAKWLEDNNYKITDNSYTYYIKGPGEETNPENYLTEIVIPVSK